MFLNIEEAIKKAAVQPVAAAKAEEKPSAKKEEKELKTVEAGETGKKSRFGFKRKTGKHSQIPMKQDPQGKYTSFDRRSGATGE